MKNISSIVVISIIIMLFAECKLYKPVETGDIEKITVDKVSLEGVNLNVFLNIENPNPYKIKIKKYYFDISLENKKIGEISSENRIVIPKKSTGAYKFPLNIKFKEMLMPAIISVIKIFSKREINVSAKGIIKAKALIFSKTIEIDKTKKVKIFK